MNRKGFTLIEVLLATVLMGIVILASFGLYEGTTRLKQSAEASGDMVLQAQFAFRSIEADLRSAWISTLDDDLREATIGRMNAGLMSTVMAGTGEDEANEELLFVGQSGEAAVGELTLPDDYLELITAAGRVAGEARGDLVRARYYIERDEEQPHRSRLIRTGRPFMAPRLGGTDRLLTESDEYTVVATGAVGFDCAYMRTTEWRDDWNSDKEKDGKWPVAVDIALTFQSPTGLKKTFHSKVYLRVPTEFEPPDEDEEP